MSATGSFAESILRFANGKPLPGKVVQALEKGLEVETPNGRKTTLPWATLSAGTRYRYEAGFKERLAQLLKPRLPVKK